MWAKSSTTRFALRVQDCQQSLVKSFLESERTDKRRRIHEYLRFRAAVKTDAGTAAAAHTDESKVRIARYPGGIERSAALIPY